MDVHPTKNVRVSIGIDPYPYIQKWGTFKVAACWSGVFFTLKRSSVTPHTLFQERRLHRKPAQPKTWNQGPSLASPSKTYKPGDSEWTNGFTLGFHHGHAGKSTSSMVFLSSTPWRLGSVCILQYFWLIEGKGKLTQSRRLHWWLLLLIDTQIWTTLIWLQYIRN